MEDFFAVLLILLVAMLENIGEINLTDLADRFKAVLEKDVREYSAERFIIHQQRANVFSAEMFHDQKTESVASL